MQNAKVYQAYYTKSEIIVNYMIDNLKLKDNDIIFEPCAGNGVFIDEILRRNKKNHIDAFELNKNSIYTLKNKYSNNKNIRIKETDTLLDDEHFLSLNFGDGVYDKIIANPPYGAWQDIAKREILKSIYPGLYVKESYTLFLYRCIKLLKENGRLVFIIPDTYLNLHMHKKIRKYILSNSLIEEILLFPSSFFPGVNFGYANLSILTLRKSNDYQKCINNEIKIYSNFKKVEELPSKKNGISIKQKKILKNPDFAFLLSNKSKVSLLLQKNKTTVGDISNCVTGFYSGNDKKFLKVLDKEIRNSKRYDVVNKDEVEYNTSGKDNITEGLINSSKKYVPIIKGGNIKFLKPDIWFMEWTKETVGFYKKNKKSRFQNSSFYFKKGIAVPMVSSRQITASLIENKLFDQSIVGIFPKNEKDLLLLLAFFNTPTCNNLIRTINPSANNSANYIKKIPFIYPDKSQRSKIIILISNIINDIRSTSTFEKSDEIEINSIFKDIYGF